MKTIKNIFMLAVVAMSLLLGSCNKGDCLTEGELAPGTVQVQLVVPTAQIEKTATRTATDGTAQENLVGKVQMLFWNVDKAKVERYIAIAPGDSPIIDASTQWNTTNGTLTIRGVNSTDKIVIYAMANGKGDELSSNFANQEAILDAIVEHSGAITDIEATPLPMSGISVETTFTVDNSTKVTVELQRMVAKVNITVALGTPFLTVYPDLKFGQTAAGEVATLELINTVDRSYVFSKTPVAMPTDAKGGISPLLVTESGLAQAMTWKATAYVFENPTIDPKMSMKINLNLPYRDGTNATVTGNVYQVEINHDAAANRVVRNHIYDVTMTVNGFGKDNITVNTLVAPWNVENINTPIDGDYIIPTITEIALLDENTTTFEVEYLGITPLTITSGDQSKFKTLTIAQKTVTKAGKTTYVATVQANYADAINEEFATLTISNGDARLDKVVKVKYTPITVKGIPDGKQNISDANKTKTFTLQSSHLSGITATAKKGNMTVTYNATSGLVTVVANHDKAITEPKLWTVDITGANGGRSLGTISFRYEPLVFASGELSRSTDHLTHDFYIFAKDTDFGVFLFQGGSKIAVATTNMNPTWDTTLSWYYIPTSKTTTPTFVPGGMATYKAFTVFAQGAQGLGDPCKYVYDLKNWRIPTADDYVELINSTKNTSAYHKSYAGNSGVEGYFFGAPYDVFIKWGWGHLTGNGFDGQATNRIPGLFEDGTKNYSFQGHRWTSSNHSQSGTDAFCSDVNDTPNRIQHQQATPRMFPVRCVRDFTGEPEVD